MSAKLGNENRVFLKNSSTYVWLSGEQNNSNNRTAEAINVSDKSSKYNTYISGSIDGSLSVTIFADDSDAAQTAALTALTAGTEVDWLVGSIGTGGAAESGEYGKGIITSISDTNNRGEVASREISIQKSGETTRI